MPLACACVVHSGSATTSRASLTRRFGTRFHLDAKRSEKATPSQRAAGSGKAPTEGNAYQRVADAHNAFAPVGGLLVSIISAHIDGSKGAAPEKEHEFLRARLRRDSGQAARIETTDVDHTSIHHGQGKSK